MHRLIIVGVVAIGIAITGCSDLPTANESSTAVEGDSELIQSLSRRLAAVEQVADLANDPTAANAGKGGTPLIAHLSGDQEVSPGDPDGSGVAMMRLNSGKERICYAIGLTDVDSPTRAHIHRGEAGVNGGVEVFFFDLVVDPPIPVPDGLADCVSVPRDLVKEIRSNPAGFYVNVHNDAFPAGAVRGQLERRSDDDDSDDSADEESESEDSDDGVFAGLGGTKLFAVLTGDAEVGDGDPDGSGEVNMRVNYGKERLCYTMHLADIEPATRAHIHRGEAGTNGGVEVFFFDLAIDPIIPVPDSLGLPSCVDVPRALIKEIRGNPAGFYVNVHNDEYPAGAVRGQLERGSDDDDSDDDSSEDANSGGSSGGVTG